MPEPTPAELPFTPDQVQQATLNLLEDFEAEKHRSEGTQRATFNILEDFEQEKARIQDLQRATFNILEDFDGEKARILDTQKATLNILDDLDGEKRKVEHAEHELSKRAEELGRSNADLERFAHVVSHDLQEPLRTITGYVQLLAQDLEGKLAPEQQRFVDAALAGSARMREMILDLLLYSRAGRQDMHPVDVDLSASLAEAVANLQASIGEAGGRIESDALPHAVADPRFIVQVLQNLLSNAIKFHGAQPPVARVRASVNAGEVTVTVEDNGMGIAPDDIGRLFVPFQRLAAAAGRPGSGIGLSTCRRIVERHGGRMWAESTLGVGSRFSFTMKAVAP